MLPASFVKPLQELLGQLANVSLYETLPYVDLCFIYGTSKKDYPTNIYVTNGSTEVRKAFCSIHFCVSCYFELNDILLRIMI